MPQTVEFEIDSAGPSVISGGDSTDNAVARWNGAGGTRIQNSLVLIDDLGRIFVPDASEPTTPVAGVVIYSEGGVLKVKDPGGVVTDLTP